LTAQIVAVRALGTWEEGGCDLPVGKRALPTHIVREIKRDGRFKSRLVAQGDKQRPGVDFTETYAPVSAYRTMGMLLAVAAHMGLALRQFDIRTVFLYGYLKDEVYAWPPRGWEHLAGGPGHVLRLHRALYGLRQAPRAWNEHLSGELKARGFVQSDADPALWILYCDAGSVFAMFYVDDGLVAAHTAEEADALVDLIAGIFEIRRMGKPSDMLGIGIEHDRAVGTITIQQSAKAHALATAFGVEGERRATPMTPAAQLELRAAQDSDDLVEVKAYQSGICSLLHVAHCTRPDIAAPVGALAAYCAKPTAAHSAAMLDVVRYVGCTARRGITFDGSAGPVEIWCDANFAGCPDTRRSVSGWAVVCFGGAVSWES
jgi:hypothetical protein